MRFRVAHFDQSNLATAPIPEEINGGMAPIQKRIDSGRWSTHTVDYRPFTKVNLPRGNSLEGFYSANLVALYAKSSVVETIVVHREDFTQQAASGFRKPPIT